MCIYTANNSTNSNSKSNSISNKHTKKENDKYIKKYEMRVVLIKQLSIDFSIGVLFKFCVFLILVSLNWLELSWVGLGFGFGFGFGCGCGFALTSNHEWLYFSFPFCRLHVLARTLRFMWVVFFPSCIHSFHSAQIKTATVQLTSIIVFIHEYYGFSFLIIRLKINSQAKHAIWFGLGISQYIAAEQENLCFWSLTNECRRRIITRFIFFSLSRQS